MKQDLYRLRISPLNEYVVKEPYPHFQIFDLFPEDVYKELAETFPEPEQMRSSFGEKRKFGAKSHDRFYLPGTEALNKNLVSDAWRIFLQDNVPFLKKLVAEYLGISPLRIKAEAFFHKAPSGADVSPHVDSYNKLAVMVIYFNKRHWEESYGGNTQVLHPHMPLSPCSAPGIENFKIVTKTIKMNNSAFFFERTTDCWHSVTDIMPPDGEYRQVITLPFYDRYVNLETRVRNMLKIKENRFIW